MHRAISITIFCMFALLAPAAPVLAQAAPAADRDPGEGPTLRFLASGEWHYGVPLRNAAGASLFVATGRGRCEDGICVWPGMRATAHVGAGGWRLGAGPSWGPLFGAEVLVTATRTWSAPRGASADSTYLGVEGGYQFLFVRPAVGVARRVDGPSGPRRTVVTWSITLRVPLFPL